MSVSANIPALGNKITKDVPEQNALNQRMMRCDFSDVVDLPVGTKALVESAEGWEVRQFNGTGWVLLEKWNIDAQKVDGHSASTGTTANTIPVRDSSGKLPGDITGNADTASKAVALSATNPIATGGTGATTAEQARANLGVAPKSHASSTTDYGAGSSTEYGHLKTHDAPNAALTAASGHALSPAGAKTELDKKLDKSGGTMTGVIFASVMDILASTKNDQYLNFNGGTNYNNGAALTIYGKDNASTPGWAVLHASDGNLSTNLIVQPSGRASVSGKAIITEAGGTMTGGLTSTQFTQKLNNIDVTATLGSATYSDSFVFRDKNDKLFSMIQPVQWGSGNHALRFIMGKKDGSHSSNPVVIEQHVDGHTSFTFAGKDILTSAGGTVNGGSLYLSGGTYRGLWGKSADNDVYFGCSEDATIGPSTFGAYMLCRSRNGSYLPGSFEIKANGTTGVHVLRGRQDDGGTLTWDSNPVLILVASWDDGNGNWYRKYSDGWIEQGGRGGKVSSGTINFHTAFRDTKYTMTASNTQNDASSTHSGGWDTTVAFSNYTATSFRFSINSSNAFNWYACGY